MALNTTAHKATGRDKQTKLENTVTTEETCPEFPSG
jgi:hypothetical protein